MVETPIKSGRRFGDGDYRQSRLEADVAGLSAAILSLTEKMEVKFEKLETRFDRSLTGVRDEIQTSKLAMPETYVLRREYHERFENMASDTQRYHGETDSRIQAVEREVDQLNAAVQGLGGGIKALQWVVAVAVPITGILVTIALKVWR
jgi:hypothetical protein